MRRKKLPPHYSRFKVNKMDNIQIIVGAVIVGLVAVYFLLKKIGGHSLPATADGGAPSKAVAVSEDVNLPVVSQPEPPAPAPMPPVQEKPLATNELDNQGPQQ